MSIHAETRIRTRFPAKLRAGRSCWKGEVRNLSQGGLFVGSISIPAEGSPVSVEIQPPGRMAVEVTGLVWWRREPVHGGGIPGFGLRLVDADEESYRVLVASLR